MTYVFELCKGRHETPATESIFPSTLNPTDTEELFVMANRAIPEDTTGLVVYVTGLTVAILAVVQVCLERTIPLTAMHYDRETDTYYPQHIYGRSPEPQ